MAKSNLVLKINMVFFSIVLLLHLLRVLYGLDASISGWAVPLWLSWLAVLFSGVLVYLNYKAL